MKFKFLLAICLVIIIPLVIALIILLPTQTFDGSQTGNDNQFLVDYRVLNKTVTHYMNFQQGDKLKCDINHIKGKLTISIDDMKGNNIYKGKNPDISSFTITIPRTGKYVISVVGVNAKGSAHFVKIE